MTEPYRVGVLGPLNDTRVYGSRVPLIREVGETTEELPSIRTARRLLYVALVVFALAAFGVAGVLVAAPPRTAPTIDPAATAAIDAEAARLATVLESTLQSVHAQALAMTRGGQIRAGIMTDAPTVKDLVTSDVQLPRNLNQTLELVQARDGQRTVLLTLPEGSPPIGHGAPARIALDGRSQLAAVIELPIAPYDPASTVTGEIVLSTPLDFALTRENLAPHALRAELAGSGWRHRMSSAQQDEAPTVVREISLAPHWGIAPLKLEVAARLTTRIARWAAPVRLTAVGIGLVLLLVLGLGLYRNRAP